jgi:hypothetical protein
VKSLIWALQKQQRLKNCYKNASGCFPNRRWGSDEINCYLTLVKIRDYFVCLTRFSRSLGPTRAALFRPNGRLPAKHNSLTLFRSRDRYCTFTLTFVFDGRTVPLNDVFT